MLSTARLGFLILALTLAGSSRPPSAAHAFPAPAVAVSKTIQNEVVNWSEFTGRTAAANLVSVTARVNGYIVSIPFKEGDVVACMAHDTAVANIRKPTLVRVGPEERFFSIEEARQLAGMIPGVRCKILAGGAHNAWKLGNDPVQSHQQITQRQLVPFVFRRNERVYLPLRSVLDIFVPMNLYETHLPVRNTEASKAFYIANVGLRFGYRDPKRDIVILWIGENKGSMLGLWGPDTDYGSPFHKSHLAIAVSLPELLAAGKRLNGHGVLTDNFQNAETTEPSVIGWMPSAQLYFRDPDGHLLEFIALLDDEPDPDFIGSLSEWRRQTGRQS